MDDIASLLTNFWGIVLVIIFFCGAIFFHELGHFLAAKWRGLKIERFSIGFGPRLVGWKGKDGVDYRISLLPLGGYVALPQLADMRLIEGEPEKPVEGLPPISYWDKMFVAVAGPAFNVILAFLFALVVWVFGYPAQVQMHSTTIGYVFPTLPLDSGQTVRGPAAEAGLQAGDKILRVDGHAIDNWADIRKFIVTGSGRDDYGNPEVDLTIERDGNARVIPVQPALQEINQRSGKRLRSIGIYPAYPIRIGAISPQSPAEAAGLKAGDVITSAGGQPVYSTPDFNEIITAHGSQPITLGVERNGQPIELAVTPRTFPSTKPLLELTSRTEETPASWKFLPQYLGGDETSLSAPAKMIVFEEPAEGDFRSLLSIGAVVSAVNGQAVNSLESMATAVEEAGEAPLQLVTRHQDKDKTVTLPAPATARIIPPETRTLVGFMVDPGRVTTHPNPFRLVADQVEMTFLFLGSLLSPTSDVGINHLSGPVGIGRVLHTFSIEDLRLAIWFSVLLNINLAILNLMPVPVLDGGHMLIATISRITGRVPPVNIVAAIQGTMMLLLFGLMFYVIFNDSLDWIGDHEAEERFNLRQEVYYLPLNFESPAK